MVRKHSNANVFRTTSHQNIYHLRIYAVYSEHHCYCDCGICKLWFVARISDPSNTRRITDDGTYHNYTLYFDRDASNRSEKKELTAISTNEYPLACCRYVELNPVRAGIVVDPAAYRWSSYGIKIGRREGTWLNIPATWCWPTTRKDARITMRRG